MASMHDELVEMAKAGRVILQPVTDKKTGVVLLDIYIDKISEENWWGSRSTQVGCEIYLGLRGKR